jgi:hypothetical protein
VPRWHFGEAVRFAAVDDHGVILLTVRLGPFTLNTVRTRRQQRQIWLLLIRAALTPRSRPDDHGSVKPQRRGVLRGLVSATKPGRSTLRKMLAGHRSQRRKGRRRRTVSAPKFF